MKHSVDPLDRLPDGGGVRHRPFNQFIIETVQIFAKSRPKVIQNNHIGLALKMFCDMAADKPGPAGNEYFH